MVWAIIFIFYYLYFFYCTTLKKKSIFDTHNDTRYLYYVYIYIYNVISVVVDFFTFPLNPNKKKNNKNLPNIILIFFLRIILNKK